MAGFGMVGFKLVERLAALDALWRYDVTVVGEEPYPAYDRVRLTGWLEHRDTGRLALAGPGWGGALGVRVVTSARVASIDRERKLVRAGESREIAYDRLVLATGSAPFVPPIEGADHDGVFVYRTLDDLLHLRRRAERVRRAVVGGGLVGLEAADALRRLGLDVVVVETAPHLMSRQLDAEAAQRLEARVRGTGVRTVTGAQVRRIEPRGNGLTLSIDGREGPLEAGVVVMAAGVRPRDELARNAGLAVAPGSGGIVVDEELRTSDPAIHAIGECGSHAGVVYGLAAPGFRMAEALAEILAGRRGRFRGYTPAVRLRLIGVDVWSLGDQGQPGSRVTWSGDDAYRQVTMRGSLVWDVLYRENWWRQATGLQRPRLRPDRHPGILGAQALAACAAGQFRGVADGARCCRYAGSTGTRSAYRHASGVRFQPRPVDHVPGRVRARHRRRGGARAPARARDLLAAPARGVWPLPALLFIHMSAYLF